MKKSTSMMTITAAFALGAMLLASASYAQGRGRGGIRVLQGPQASYVDADSNGVCNLAGSQQRSGKGQRAGRGCAAGNCEGGARSQSRFLDADGDGVCDNFVDEDGDGIKDNSPLARLEFSDTQKAQIAQIRASGPGPHREAVHALLSEEQLAQLEAIRAEKRASRGFVDADDDGINDNSPLAQLELSDEQKAQIAEIRASGAGPHRDAITGILTPEQTERLEALRTERQTNCQGLGQRKGGRGRGQGRGKGSCARAAAYQE